MMEEKEFFIIANHRNVPFYKYNEEIDNSGEWVIYHSKGYLRKKRKLRYKRNFDKEIEKQKEMRK